MPGPVPPTVRALAQSSPMPSAPPGRSDTGGEGAAVPF